MRNNIVVNVALSNKIDKLILGLCFILFSSYLPAQNSIGLQLGISKSKFDVIRLGNFKIYDFSDEFDHGGLFTEFFYSYSVNRFLKFRSTFNYVKRGAIVERDYGIVGHNKISLNYLGMGTSVGFSPIKHLTIHSGLHVGYLMFTCFYWDDNRVRKIKGSEDTYDDFDIGYKTGIILNVNNILVSASYFKSIGPIWELDHSLFSSNTIKYRNSSIELSIGYNFNLGKTKK